MENKDILREIQHLISRGRYFDLEANAQNADKGIEHLELTGKLIKILFENPSNFEEIKNDVQKMCNYHITEAGTLGNRMVVRGINEKGEPYLGRISTIPEKYRGQKSKIVSFS